MPSLRTIATSTALVLLLGCNRILPTKAAKKDNDDGGISYDFETTSNLDVTCASAEPSVFTSPACYTLVSNISTESMKGAVINVYADYQYAFYGQELEGGPVDESVDERIGRTVYMFFSAAGEDYSFCVVYIGNYESCECTPCYTDADDLMSTKFRIDCSHIDGGIDASDTCVVMTPYPPIYDPHLGKDNDDFTFPTDDDFAFPTDDVYGYPVDDDHVPPSRIGSLFRRFGGRVDKILAFLKSGLPSFRRGKRND
jgi:hypothetical protein